MFRLFFLGFAKVFDALFAAFGGVFKFIAVDCNVFPKDHLVKSTHFHGFERVINTENDHTCVLSNFIKETADQLLFLNELDVSKAVCGQRDSLTEPIVLSIRNIKESKNFASKSLIKFLSSRKLVFERC